MFFSTLVSLLALPLLGQSMAAPLAKPFPMHKMESGVDGRDSAAESMINRQFSDSIPAMAPKGDILPFKNGGVNKRRFIFIRDPAATYLDEEDRRQFSDLIPPEGQLRPFANGAKRDSESEDAMAPDEPIELFAIGVANRQFADSIPAMAPNGQIKPFENGGTDKRQL